MHEHWLPEWREAQREFLTPNNYDLTTPESAVVTLLNERMRAAERRDDPFPSTPRGQISFNLPEVGHIGRVARGEAEGEFYGRAGFKERKVLEQMLLALEAGYAQVPAVDVLDKGLGGAPLAPELLDAAVFPSGMSAIDTVARELVRHIPPKSREDKRVIRGNTVYTHSKNVFDDRMREYGFAPAIVLVDTTDPQNVLDVLKRHKGQIVALFYEPVTNPLIQYTDTRAVAEIADAYGVPVVVDNTFLTPYLQQPFRMGADIVIHSMTKYLNGHGDMLGGAVIGPRAFMKKLKELQVQSGAVIQGPDSAHVLSMHLLTFPARMAQHVANAAECATFLRDHPAVAEVYSPYLGTATRNGSAGGVVTFKLAGATEEERTRRETALMQYLIDHNHKPVAYAVSLGEERHLMIGETTLGLPSSYEPGTVRFAVGRTPTAEEAIPFLKGALDSVSR